MFAFIRTALITGLWIMAVVLMVVPTVYNDRHGAAIFMGWSLLIAAVAAVVTCWHLLIHERGRILAAAYVAASACLEQQELRSVP